MKFGRNTAKKDAYPFLARYKKQVIGRRGGGTGVRYFFVSRPLYLSSINILPICQLSKHSKILAMVIHFPEIDADRRLKTPLEAQSFGEERIRYFHYHELQ